MKLIDKDALVAEIERLVNNYDKALDYEAALEDVRNFLDTLEVKEVDINKISENLAKADEYLGYTHTSNLVHNMPMIVARLRGAIKELYNAKLFQLTNNVKYRMERLGFKAQEGE